MSPDLSVPAYLTRCTIRSNRSSAMILDCCEFTLKWRRLKGVSPSHKPFGISGITARGYSHMMPSLQSDTMSNSHPLHGHLPHQERSCKQTFPTSVTLLCLVSLASFRCSIAALSYGDINWYALWESNPYNRHGKVIF